MNFEGAESETSERGGAGASLSGTNSYKEVHNTFMLVEKYKHISYKTAYISGLT